MVVDDEPLIRCYVRDILEEAGYLVEEAGSADDALEHVCGSCKLVVTDIEMPGSMNGLALCQRIHSRWPAIGLIIMSGWRLPRADELPSQAQMLTKPFSPARLLDAVAAVLPVV
jgi:two-component system, response regulator PdtaR